MSAGDNLHSNFRGLYCGATRSTAQSATAARRSRVGSGSGAERRSGKTGGDKVPAEQLIGSEGAAAVALLLTFPRRP